MIYYDDRLNELAFNKSLTGCRQVLKDLATHYLGSQDYSGVLAFYKEAQDRGHIRTDCDVTIVKISNGVLFFDMPLHQVEEKLRDVKPLQKARVPDKVLVNMLAARIQRIHQNVRSNNGHRRYRNQNLKMNLPEDRLPEFRTIESIRQYVKSPTDNFLSCENKKVLRELENKMFCKAELNDGHVSQAMDLVITGQVMES
jgi:hypothetical protein